MGQASPGRSGGCEETRGTADQAHVAGLRLAWMNGRANLFMACSMMLQRACRPNVGTGPEEPVQQARVETHRVLVGLDQVAVGALWPDVEARDGRPRPVADQGLVGHQRLVGRAEGPQPSREHRDQVGPRGVSPCRSIPQTEAPAPARRR